MDDEGSRNRSPPAARVSVGFDMALLSVTAPVVECRLAKRPERLAALRASTGHARGLRLAGLAAARQDRSGVTAACRRVARLRVACGVASSSAVDNRASARIHPSAVVHSEAKIGEVIGENCAIHSGAVIGDPTIPGSVALGNENIVGCHAAVGVRCQDLKYNGGECSLEVGDRNDIREYASIHLSSREDWTTKIGDDNLIMGYCHVAHDCILGMLGVAP
eukprot:scaffold3068_cov401-Prasinococcus_capsulatus_cf.AAC.10